MSANFYKQNYGGSRIKPPEPTEQPKAEQTNQTQGNGIDSLPPIPQDYEMPMEVGEAAPQEQPVLQQLAEEAPQSGLNLASNAPQPKQVEEEPEYKASFRELREAKLKAERERDEAIRIIQEQFKQQQNPVVDKLSATEEEFDLDVNPDDLVEGKHLKKYVAEVKKLQKELQQQKQQTVVTDQRTKLRNDYNDFDKVVNEESLYMLQSRYPAIYNTLNASSGSLYDTGVSTYTMMKQLGLYKEDNYVADRLKAQQNAAKPKPLASISPQKGDSALSNANAFANGLTADLSRNLWKETQEAMGNKTSATHNWYLKK